MSTNSGIEFAKICARIASDAKAEDVRIYDLRGMSSLTDFMIVCTGLSVPHLRALTRDIEEKVEEETQLLPSCIEDASASLWSVVDYIDVMIHLMGQETREFYALDTLWKEAPLVEF